MICSKQDLREYIEADQNALGGGTTKTKNKVLFRSCNMEISKKDAHL